MSADEHLSPQQFYDSERTYYRGMEVSLPSSFEGHGSLPEYLMDRGVGTHWTPERDKAEHHRGTTFVPKGRYSVLLEGRIPDTSVASREDAAHGGMMPNEEEVPVRSGADIDVSRINVRLPNEGDDQTTYGGRWEELPGGRFRA